MTSEREARDAYTAHSGELYSFACRLLGDTAAAEEVLEETFIRAWRTKGRFDPRINSLRTWLFAILCDVATDRWPIQLPEESLRSWQVEEAMRRISSEHRQVLLETFYRGRPYGEVAADLGVSEEVVRIRLHDGLRLLKATLEDLAVEG